MKHITVSAAIIHDDQNRIFATQRGSGDWKDWWEFPGGKIEPGETAEEAVRREIWEELETRITVGELLHTIEWDYPKFHLTMHCFLCTIESGSLTLLEHEAARWLAPNELDSVQWLPADWEVIEMLKRRMAENDSQAPTQKDTHTKEPVYTLLGESGLVEDEEGNIFSASEISKLNESQDSNLSSPSSAFHSFGVSSVLDDKANPAHWYHHYDPRYCGPSREAFMEEMARKYRHPSQQTTEKETTSTSAVAEPIKGTIPKETIHKETIHKETVPKETVHKETIPKETIPKETVPKEIVPDVISGEAKLKANQEQAEVERCGLHPTYREAFSYNFPGLNFVAIVDREGTAIISNDHYLDISFYSNGLARAQSRETRKFGFVDRQGKEVIPCTWRSAGLFNEYLAGVQNDNYRCGYVDVTGRLVIPCVWKETWPFQEGLARVQDESGKIGMIDQSGKTIIPCVWKSMGDFSEGLAGVQDENGKCGFIDKTGKIVIPCQWMNAWSFCEGLAVVQDFNKRLGFINKSGELVIPCRWKKVNYFQNGRAKVSDSKNFLLQDKWVYIDKEGRIVTDICR